MPYPHDLEVGTGGSRPDPHKGTPRESGSTQGKFGTQAFRMEEGHWKLSVKTCGINEGKF